MTAARQKRKQYCAWILAAGGLALSLSVAAPGSIAATTEQIVVDWHTGLAIGGYDPVAFFTDGKPMTGSADFEFHYGGAIWRFCNVGNREAFAARPDIYMPQFGGYDPTGVARGVAVSGNPKCVADQRSAPVLVLRSRRIGKIRRRYGSRDCRGRAQMAGRGPHPQSLISPRAIKPGMSSSLVP